MRRIVVFVAACLLSQAAAAAGDPWDALMQEDGKELKPQYRKCFLTDECTSIYNPCTGPIAVSTVSEKEVSAKLAELTKDAHCTRSRYTPMLHCGDLVCKIVPERK